jgi:hypothetical protein
MATWTSAHISTLAARYANEPTASIAAAIGHSASATYQRARSMGLRKSAEYLAGPESGRSNLDLGAACRFRKGHATWNKGIRFASGGRSSETQFKPGSKPQTWKPIGSERTDKDGLKVRKVSDTGNRRKDWVGVHVLAWVENFGPVPDGHVVTFKDGNSENVAPNNLECVTRAELMRRNSVHRLPKELAELCQLRGALNRQISKRTSK